MRHAPARDQAPNVAAPRRHLCRTDDVSEHNGARTKIDGLGVVSSARTRIADTAEEHLNRSLDQWGCEFDLMTLTSRSATRSSK